VARVASSLGLAVRRVPLESDARAMLGRITELDADVVVNLAESWAGRVQSEPGIAWLLELRGLAYTGATPRALALCLEKPLTRARLAAAGVPVPEGVVMSDARAPVPAGGAGTWIVKPAAQDASHGIDAGSVVEGEDAIRARVAQLVERGLGPAL